jgi:hypothetical protein
LDLGPLATLLLVVTPLCLEGENQRGNIHRLESLSMMTQSSLKLGSTLENSSMWRWTPKKAA